MSMTRKEFIYIPVCVCLIIGLLGYLISNIEYLSDDSPTAQQNPSPSHIKPESPSESNDTKTNDKKFNHETKEGPFKNDSNEKPPRTDRREETYNFRNADEPRNYESHEEPQRNDRREETYNFRNADEPSNSESNKETPRFESNKETPRFESNKETPRFESNKETPRFESNREIPRFESNREIPRFESNDFPRDSENREESVNPEINIEPDYVEINQDPQPTNLPHNSSSMGGNHGNTRETLQTDFSNDNVQFSRDFIYTFESSSEQSNDEEDSSSVVCFDDQESSSEDFTNAEEPVTTNLPQDNLQRSENSQNSNLAQETQPNRPAHEIPQGDSLPSFQNTFDDSEIEDSSSITNQRRIFENFEAKVDYFKQQIASRYINHRYGYCRINVNRDTALEDSLTQILNSSPESLRKRPSVSFNNEQGIDAGGLTKEWLELVIKKALNPEIGYFHYTNEKNTTVRPFIYSGLCINHLEFFKFVGRVLGMAIFNNYNVRAYLDKSVFKSMLKKKCSLSDLEEIDSVYYNSLVSIKNMSMEVFGSDLTFDHEINELGVFKVIDLIPNGRNIVVTDENKNQYIDLKVQMMLCGVIKAQLNSLRAGLYEIIDEDLISIFTESELELLICGNPHIDIEDWKNNTEYFEYTSDSTLIRWFWRAVEEFTESERAKLLQFATGSSRVPFGGFANLQSNGENTKFRITRLLSLNASHLPRSHTCFNQLDLPNYPTYDNLKEKILLAINEGSDGFGML